MQNDGHESSGDPPGGGSRYGFSGSSCGPLDAIFVIYAKNHAQRWSRELWGPSGRWQQVWLFGLLLWSSRGQFRDLRENRAERWSREVWGRSVRWQGVVIGFLLIFIDFP